MQEPQFPSSTGRKPMSRKTMEIGSWDIPVDAQRNGMEIDWMELTELSEAIPPVFTQHIGRFLKYALLSNTACTRQGVSSRQFDLFSTSSPSAKSDGTTPTPCG